MDNWRTFTDYEIEYVDESTGEITWRIIGKTRAKREYRVDKKQTRIELNHEYKTKRIIYRCYKHEQLRLF